MHGGICYLLVGLWTLCILQRPRVGVFAQCIHDMLSILYVTDSLFLATPKSKRVLMHSCHMLFILCVVDSLFLATPKRKRVVPSLPVVRIFLCCWGVHSSPSSLLAGTLLLCWSVHTS